MMPSALNLRAPRLSMAAGDTIAMERSEAIALGRARAPMRGRQSVRPARVERRIVCWLVQDIRHVAPKVDPLAEEPEMLAAAWKAER